MKKAYFQDHSSYSEHIFTVFLEDMQSKTTQSADLAIEFLIATIGLELSGLCGC
jgi:hypothetical protein